VPTTARTIEFVHRAELAANPRAFFRQAGALESYANAAAAQSDMLVWQSAQRRDVNRLPARARVLDLYISYLVFSVYADCARAVGGCHLAAEPLADAAARRGLRPPPVGPRQHALGRAVAAPAPPARRRAAAAAPLRGERRNSAH